MNRERLTGVAFLEFRQDKCSIFGLVLEFLGAYSVQRKFVVKGAARHTQRSGSFCNIAVTCFKYTANILLFVLG